MTPSVCMSAVSPDDLTVLSSFKHLMNTVAFIGQPPSEAPPLSRLSLPYKVMKSLDRDVYRNLEFDVWQDTCKGELAGHVTQ